MQNYQRVVQDNAGNVIFDATFTVYDTGTTTEATAYSEDDENSIPLTYPAAVNSAGYVVFFAPDGLYDVLIESGDYSVTISEVALADGLSAVNAANNAATSETNAATSETNAAASAAAAAASYDDFDDRYLGAKASNPTLDNDGDPLATGALHFNTTANEMRVWDGATWLSLSATGTLQVANNLSDVANVATSRTNLGLGSAALNNTGDFYQTTNNLSDVTDAGAARTNLGLGNSATLNTGTTAGTVATGDHTHATTDITSGTFADARIAATNVTQHEASLTITESQISDLQSYSLSSHNHTLDALSNTTITANTAGETLIWNGTAWVNNTLAEAGIQAADADTAKTDVQQEWTQQQNFNATTLTDGATINWDTDTNQVTTVTLGGNRTMAAPTNMNDGSMYLLGVYQDATGSRTLSWNAVYKFPGSTAPTLTTTASAKDYFTFYSDGTNMYLVGSSLDVS